MKNNFLYLLNNSKEVIRTFLFSLLIYFLLLFLFIIQGESPISIIRDLAQTCNQSLGVGFISNLGVILWVGISFILFFALKNFNLGNSSYKKFIVSGFILSGLLALDDFFLIHDKYITQEFIFLFYLIFSIYILKKFIQQILLIDRYHFFLSYALFSFSIIVDIVLQNLFPSVLIYSQIIEEAFKFSGICCWFIFWWKSVIFINNERN